jgi:hypothetical protein
VTEVWLDGERLPDGRISLRDDGVVHDVRVVIEAAQVAVS